MMMKRLPLHIIPIIAKEPPEPQKPTGAQKIMILIKTSACRLSVPDKW